MGHPTKEISTIPKNLGVEDIFLPVGTFMKDFGEKIVWMVKDSINMSMAPHLLVILAIIRNMVWENLPGQMANTTKVSTKTTKNMATASIVGQKVAIIKVFGRMV